MGCEVVVRSQEEKCVLHHLNIHMCVCMYVLPLVQVHDIFDIPENDLFLVEDVNRNMAARVQIMELMRDISLHRLYKLLLSINQALNQLAKDKRTHL